MYLQQNDNNLLVNNNLSKLFSIGKRIRNFIEVTFDYIKYLMKLIIAFKFKDHNYTFSIIIEKYINRSFVYKIFL